MVVLYEVGIDPGGGEKVAAAIALEKKPRASPKTRGSRMRTSGKAVGVAV
jgi:hypothetical protein